MSSLVFKIFLPVLLGYTLFVGLSGRFNPFSKPSELKPRPSWLLGNWVGLSVTLVVGIVLHMAYKLPLDAVKTLVKPTGLLLAALIVPGLIAYAVYRFVIGREIRKLESAEAKMSMTAGEIMDGQIENMDFDDTVAIEPMSMVAETSSMEDQTIISEGNDSNEMPTEDNDAIITFDSITESDENTNEPLVFNTVSLPDSTDLVTSESTESVAADDENIPQITELNTTADAIEVAEVAETAELTKLKSEIDALKRSLDTESSLRSQTETHLRITRKALRNLEGDTRDFESSKADALMSVEDQLDSRIKEVAAAQARANREEAARVEAETTIVNMKQDLLAAKRELRRNTEARAKALGTANKTVAFARQSVQARTRAEARIKQLESRLKLSQETVSSLIASLDKEKTRTQSDVTEMAKELILQQKRINDKRTLDEASRRTPKRLTRRTAKKVS